MTLEQFLAQTDMLMMQTHDERWRYHVDRLAAARSPPKTMREVLDHMRLEADFREARRLATMPDWPKIEDEVAAALKSRPEG